LLLQIAFASTKSVTDQEAAESQSRIQVAQQKVGYDYTPVDLKDHHSHEYLDEHDHGHHHHEPDPGFWKKKLIWKEGMGSIGP
jgi:hypothetical protein